MKGAPEGHGDTIPSDLSDELPGGLGKPLERTKPWGPLDDRRQRRDAQDRAARPRVGDYYIWTEPDGTMRSEKV